MLSDVRPYVCHTFQIPLPFNRRIYVGRTEEACVPAQETQLFQSPLTHHGDRTIECSSEIVGRHTDCFPAFDL